MLTSEDVAGVPLFSALPAPELERLARVSADLHLSPGEFAVHERGEGALFAVLEGRIEVVKTIDGLERGSAGGFPAPFSERCQLFWGRGFLAATAPPNRPA